MEKLRLLLLPFSLLYRIVSGLRNKFFDWGILKSSKFEIPVLCVGNITIGGTGKTPHIEYLINLLHKKYKVGILSRGYKRKTKGFVLARKGCSPAEIGDEPYQIYMKFKKSKVAVCESRVKGVKNLLDRKPKTEIVLLDDAFQHRYIQPGLSILLVDYNHPVFDDFLLPAGNLRESFSARKRAQIVIVSKSPDEISFSERKYWTDNLKLHPQQNLFFTSFEYGSLEPVFKNKSKNQSLKKLKKDNVKILLVAGIANPKPLMEKLEETGLEFETIFFPDHHNFSQKDIDNIKSAFKSISGKQKIILTTEKDAVRLRFGKKTPRLIKENSYYLPVKVRFLDDTGDDFNRIILKYARKN